LVARKEEALNNIRYAKEKHARRRASLKNHLCIRQVSGDASSEAGIIA
jgi:hypothetical protein